MLRRAITGLTRSPIPRCSRTTIEVRLLAWAVPAMLALLAVPLLGLTVLGALSARPAIAVLPGLMVVRLVAMIQFTIPARARTDDGGPDPISRLEPQTMPEVDALIRAAVRDAGLPEPVTVEIHEDEVLDVRASAGATVVGIGLSHLVLLPRGDLRFLLGREARDAARDPRRRTALAGALRAFDSSDAWFSDSVSPLRRPMHALTRALRAHVRRLARAAELRSDRAAPGSAAPRELAGAIGAAAIAATLARDFWLTDFQVVVRAGGLPPLAAGLRTFAAHRVETADDDGLLEAAWQETGRPEVVSSPAERVAALWPTKPVGFLALLAAGGPPIDDRGLRALDDQLLPAVASRLPGAPRRTTWAAGLLAGLTLQARTLIAQHRDWLGGLDLDAVPPALMALWDPETGPAPEDSRATALLALLMLTMLDDGWTLDAEPGAPYRLRHGEMTAWPFAIGSALQTRAATPDDFHDWCRACGVERLLDVDDVLEPDAMPARSPLPEVLRDATATAPAGAALPAEELLGPATTRLSSSGADRATGVLATCVMILFAGPLIVLASLRAVDPGSGDPIAARLGCVVVALATLALVIHVFRAIRRAFLAHPTLSLGPTGALTIVHPALLRAPLVLPREVLLAADVDTAGSEARFPVHDDAGPLAPSGPQILGFLWDRDRGSRLPMLDGKPGRPNVAIVLRRAVEAPRPVRGTPFHSTQKGERIDALLLRSADPDAARVLLSTVGILRPLTLEDLEAASRVS